MKASSSRRTPHDAGGGRSAKPPALGGVLGPSTHLKGSLKVIAVSSDAVEPLQAGLLASRQRVRQPYRRSDASLGSRQCRLSIAPLGQFGPLIAAEVATDPALCTTFRLRGAP